MTTSPGRSGLIMEEPLLWEKGKPGRRAMSIPDSDIPKAELAGDLLGIHWKHTVWGRSLPK